MTTKHLILHAGLHKTGTTAIQNYLFTHPDFLDTGYLHAGVANSSLIMLKAFKKDIAALPSFSHKVVSEKYIASHRQNARAVLRKQMSRLDKSRAILSAEAISMFSLEELAELEAFFRKDFQDVSVHLYVRSLKSHLESAYQEKLKTRYAELFEGGVPDYCSMILKFDECFGQSNVFIHKYAPEEFPEGNVVGHFLQQLNLDASALSRTRDNSRLSLPAVQLLYTYRQFFPVQDKRDGRRIEKLETLTGEPFSFHPDLFHQLTQSANENSAWFEERAGFSFDEPLHSCLETGVRTEEDLRVIDESSIDWLIGKRRWWHPKQKDKSGLPETIARAVRHLA